MSSLTGVSLSSWITFCQAELVGNRSRCFQTFGPELRAKEAIDDQVSGGVDNEEEVGEVEDEKRPEAELVESGLSTGNALPDGGQFVQVQQDPWEVTNQKNLEVK